ncbi:efflux transporter outer membrane subunit [Paraburkholderia caballeronis]|uniref:Efflux transporter, outer membrane factor (OMF) lipoprotein, NodT family n=1 Tax=Paraburkholderia caballeronis TaxID=416943 RepID=A0A1H7LQR4_9BURK|nr:efflux transporter outer membrane subunit [Paraburkholderia caballeronis]PXW28562.1 NodT family efflux transporter outer membrane factor (OMF) lipoprotein [Paraburkholderia caballeronis]PXX03928.1 NodT family efflux transporter outer membrane factor (OMF) lipoprotein [Paraburkholderia caballeronis]RAK04672.1 NodT family efflux transporter outer membrane factor (OMF) lipoprotein [Paraburkholderia caballeronis]SED70212.1 efflux transporter, outer membrane factor (OMF) lipoprotein, NodT family 
MSARRAPRRSSHDSRGRLFALAPLTLVLAACMTVGPNYKLPDNALVNAPLANAPLDSAGAPVSQDPVPSNWWRLYDDPVLDQLVEDALKSNTDLRVAAANLARSRAALAVADAQGGFSGGATAAFERAQESAEQYLLFSKLPVENEGNVGISISYEVDLFGKLRRGVEAARADSDAVEAAGDLARIAVVADVVRAYVESCSAAEELAIAQDSLKLQRERVDLSKRLRDAGRGNQPDVTRGVTQVQTLAADIPRFVSRRRIAQYQLAMLLARSPADLPPGALACERLPRLNQPIPVGDGATLLKRRPDVREAERQLAASTARIGVAVGEMYPSISIGASTGSTGILGDLLSPETNRWAFGPLISWTFPANGQRARVRETEAATGGALAHFDGVVLNALRETQTSLATYAADYQRAESLRTAYESARVSADETHRLYAAGRESFISDLDATRTLTSVHAQVAAAEGQVALDQVRLFQSLGGGWEKEE